MEPPPSRRYIRARSPARRTVRCARKATSSRIESLRRFGPRLVARDRIAGWPPTITGEVSTRTGSLAIRASAKKRLSMPPRRECGPGRHPGRPELEGFLLRSLHQQQRGFSWVHHLIIPPKTKEKSSARRFTSSMSKSRRDHSTPKRRPDRVSTPSPSP